MPCEAAADFQALPAPGSASPYQALPAAGRHVCRIGLDLFIIVISVREENGRSNDVIEVIDILNISELNSVQTLHVCRICLPLPSQNWFKGNFKAKLYYKGFLQMFPETNSLMPTLGWFQGSM